MTKFITLIAFLSFSTSGFSGENNATKNVLPHLENVSIYTNIPQKSFIVDFHENDFKSVRVEVSDLSGKTIIQYELGDMANGSLAEMNIPEGMSKNEITITVISEGKSLVNLADIYAAY